MPRSEASIPQRKLDYFQDLIARKSMTVSAFASFTTSSNDLVGRLSRNEKTNFFSSEFVEKFVAAMDDITEWCNRNGESIGLNSYLLHQQGKYGTHRSNFGKKKVRRIRKLPFGFKTKPLSGSYRGVHSDEQVPTDKSAHMISEFSRKVEAINADIRLSTQKTVEQTKVLERGIFWDSVFFGLITVASFALLATLIYQSVILTIQTFYSN